MEMEPNDIPVTAACRALGVSRATLYRNTQMPKPRKPRTTPSKRALTMEERAKVLEILNSPGFSDQPPAEVYAALLSQGIYLASIRTMYRILESAKQSKERRRGHVHRSFSKPQIVATKPNQAWSWDITKLCGPTPGTFYCLYTIMDLFSRYIVGWFIDDRENANLAAAFVQETAIRHGIAPGTLTLHSDRGSPMTGQSMTDMLATLQIGRSLSRPRISNDNPHVESLFKTVKYQPDYPGRFESKEHARSWCSETIHWYNEVHFHEGLNLYTPKSVFDGTFSELAITRQRAMDAAYQAHPERFVKRPPKAKLPPKRVHINAPEMPPSEERPTTYQEVTANSTQTSQPEKPLSARRRTEKWDPQGPARPEPLERSQASTESAQGGHPARPARADSKSISSIGVQ